MINSYSLSFQVEKISAKAATDIKNKALKKHLNNTQKSDRTLINAHARGV